MKGFLRKLLCLSQKESTYYGVTRDGTLLLDLQGLLASGKMKRQLEAARKLGLANSRNRRSKSI